MHRAFDRLNQVLNLFVASSQTRIQCFRGHHKSFPRLGIPAGHQSMPQQAVHGSFERIPAPPDLVLNQLGNIVLNGKSGSHIMMLYNKAS